MKSSLYSKLKYNFIVPLLVRNKPKIFCIGANKTGTTSLKKTFEQLGFAVGRQREAENLMPEYQIRNFSAIAQYCRKAQVFQDFPFSYPDTYQYLDREFPGSKFILTIRDSPDQWYNSLVSFHSKKFGKGSQPIAQNLKDAAYVYPGWAWEAYSQLFGTEEPLYQKEKLVQWYKDYNAGIQSYFNGRKDLLVLNLAAPGSFQEFTEFLNVRTKLNEFPWENKTQNIKIK